VLRDLSAFAPSGESQNRRDARPRSLDRFVLIDMRLGAAGDNEQASGKETSATPQANDVLPSMVGEPTRQGASVGGGETPAAPPAFSSPLTPLPTTVDHLIIRDDVPAPRFDTFMSSSEAAPDADSTGVVSSNPLFRWVAVALVILVLAQGAIITWLMTRGTEAEQAEPKSGAEFTEAPASATGQPRAAGSVSPLEPTAQAETRAAEAQVPSAKAAAGEPSGSVRVLSPIPLDVVWAEEVIGSTATGPVRVAPGTHELEFVNERLSFRTKQTVRVTADRIVPVRIDPPNGVMTVSAQPWARVWIDGKAVGQTPLSNVAVGLGEHEIVFRHPQLGERRQHATVRSGALTRVNQTFPQ
jgi:hypothetical protein